MGILILVDEGDHAPCNLRCGKRDHEAFCARYPACLAGCANRVRGLFDGRLAAREVVREQHGRSSEGGRSRTRLVHDPVSDSTVEEVELYCTTLEFPSLEHG